MFDRREALKPFVGFYLTCRIQVFTKST